MRPLNSSAIPALAFIASELLQHTAYVFKAISRYIAISTVESIPFDDLSDRRHTARSSTAHVWPPQMPIWRDIDSLVAAAGECETVFVILVVLETAALSHSSPNECQ